MISREACRGCRDDFYNGRVNIDGGTRCWSAKDGRMVTRFKIGHWVAPTTPGAFEKVRVPSCYHQPGVFAYYKTLPDFVKVSDLRKRRPETPQLPREGR